MSDAPPQPRAHTLSWASSIVRAFIDSKVTPLVLFSAILVGGFAVIQLPREEEPQILVPTIDIFVRMEGASPREVEERVTKPMERFLWEIPGVEYVYTTSSPEGSLAIVRFVVGHDQDDAVVKVTQKMSMHLDLVPAGASLPLIKPRTIDDVPVLALTFSSAVRDAYELRRVAAEVADAVKAVPDISETSVIGGRPRTVRILLDAASLAAHGLAPSDLLSRLGAANARSRSGALRTRDEELVVDAGRFLRSSVDVERTVVGVFGGRPVYLADVARVVDGPDEPSEYVFLEPGRASKEWGEGPFPAVTLSIAKRKGTNAVSVNRRVMDVLEGLKGDRIPNDVGVSVTRDYGHTAQEKSDELLLHMGIAVLSVTMLIWFALGWRESGIVAIAIPVTLALTLAFFYLLGYTLNRITLFALIFSIGILVDDPIVDVENIVRHFRMPSNRGRNLLEVTVEAINEVRSPLILATLTVICSVLPMGFVRGLMGPYMRPIPVGASAAMGVSMMVAFVITPWAALRILRGPALRGGLARHGEGEREGFLTRAYRAFMGVLVRSHRARHAFLLVMVLLLVGAVALFPLRAVVVKMLPFDNKSELQVIVDMSEGTPLEESANVARELAGAIRGEPEVRDIEVYAGTAAPFNFNGLVRRYYLRSGPNVADLQVNLVGKHERETPSHAFAKRIRARLDEVARERGARIKIAEVPPGPPVLETLVAEVYGADADERLATARKVRDLFRRTEGVVDVDWYVEEDQGRDEVRVDEVKAALNGISVTAIKQVLSLALKGDSAGLLHDEREREDVGLVLRLPKERRSTLDDLLSLRLRSDARDGGLVPVRELVHVEHGMAEKSIYHKNLLPVVYVIGDVYGRGESPVYAIENLRKSLSEVLPKGTAEFWLGLPDSTVRSALKWDGEMHITLEVFRDLGLAFAAVLVLIFVLVVAWFRSFSTPLVIMAAIPFSLVGILPAHWAMGAFFTATSMIGFIAGAGIVVRNSIILVDFIELRLAQGMPLAEAVVDAGAVRFRPMLLTASAVMVGAGIILFDPIFQGLAISLIAGEVASMLLSRMAVPVLYYMRSRHGQREES